MTLMQLRRFACGCTLPIGGPESVVGLDLGINTINVEVQPAGEVCFACALKIKIGPEEPESSCLDGQHDMRLEADRLRGTAAYAGEIYGTGGWDLCFRCVRKPCRASKYTTYGLMPLYLSDARGHVVYQQD